MSSLLHRVHSHDVVLFRAVPLVLAFAGGGLHPGIKIEPMTAFARSLKSLAFIFQAF